MIKLGVHVSDKYTSFKGLALARTEYLHGCPTVGILPESLNDQGLPRDLVWMDESRLVECNGDPEKQVGFCHEIPDAD